MHPARDWHPLLRHFPLTLGSGRARDGIVSPLRKPASVYDVASESEDVERTPALSNI